MKSISNYLQKNNRINKVMKALLSITVLSALFGATLTYAANGGGDGGIGMATIASNVGDTMTSVAHIVNAVSLIAGICFVMSSFFKFHQHKLNPTQVPLSQGLTLLMIGAALILLPVLLPTAKQAVFGKQAQISTVSGSAIDKIIGGKSGK